MINQIHYEIPHIFESMHVYSSTCASLHLDLVSWKKIEVIF